jgi:hypothetical protein
MWQIQIFRGWSVLRQAEERERECVMVACLLGLAVENGISSLFGGALLIFWCSCDVLLCSAIDDNDASPPIELFQNSFSR